MVRTEETRQSAKRGIRGRTGGVGRWILVGLLGAAGGLQAALADAPNSPPGSQSSQTQGTDRKTDKAISRESPGAGQGRGASEAQSPAWETYVTRLRNVTQEQARIRMEQEILRRRINQSGEMTERTRDRVASRLHELDDEERQIRQKKQEVVSQIAAQGDKLRQQLEEAQADLITRQAAETDPEKQRELESKLREVDGLLRHWTDIQENPERFVDFIPGGGRPRPERPGPGPGPDESPIPPQMAARRIQQMEEQIRFLRRRIDVLERELQEMKQMMGSEALPTPGESQTGPQEGPPTEENPAGPPPAGGFERWRGPERPPIMRPRRAPIPPAGFAPGSEPGLEPQKKIPGETEPGMSAGPGIPEAPGNVPPPGPPPDSAPE